MAGAQACDPPRRAPLSLPRPSRIIEPSGDQEHAPTGRYGMKKRTAHRRALCRRSRARRCAGVRAQDGRIPARISQWRRPRRHERRGRRPDRVLARDAGRADPGRPCAGGQEGCARRRAEGPTEAQLPRQGWRPGRARRQAAGGRDARAAARRRHHADAEVLHPQQRPAARARGRAGRLEAHHRRGGQQARRDHAGRAQEALRAEDVSHGARVRRQRPLLLRAAGARQPVDQRRRRLRGMDRRGARRRAAGPRASRRRPSTPPTTAPTCICRAIPSS